MAIFNSYVKLPEGNLWRNGAGSYNWFYQKAIWGYFESQMSDFMENLNQKPWYLPNKVGEFLYIFLNQCCIWEI
jgi:hypothetical protein